MADTKREFYLGIDLGTTNRKNVAVRATAYLIPFVGFFALLLVWDILSRFSGWSRQVFPGPVVVLVSMGELLGDGTLVRHTVASLFRVTVGFYLAVLLGIPIGIALGMMKTARSLINPVIQFMRPISPLAWIPLARGEMTEKGVAVENRMKSLYNT